MNKILVVIRNSILFGCLITWLQTFILITLQAAEGGPYEVILATNIYGEHYAEVVVLVIGVVLCGMSAVEWLLQKDKSTSSVQTMSVHKSD